jgi:hypothetical protein
VRLYKVCCSLSWHFCISFKTKSKEAYQEVASGVVSYLLPQEGSNQYLVIVQMGTLAFVRGLKQKLC